MIRTVIKATIGGDTPGPLTSELEQRTKSAFRVFFYGRGPLKGLFREADIPISELARKLGVAPSNLTLVLQGRHFPNKRSVQKFADRLKIPVDQMMSRLVVHVIEDLYLIGRDVPLIEAEESGELLSASDAALYAGTYQQKITAAIRSGELTAHRVGSVWKIPLSAVYEYRRKHK